MDRPLLGLDKKLQVFDLLTAASLRSIPTKLSGKRAKGNRGDFQTDLNGG